MKDILKSLAILALFIGAVTAYANGLLPYSARLWLLAPLAIAVGFRGAMKLVTN